MGWEGIAAIVAVLGLIVTFVDRMVKRANDLVAKALLEGRTAATFDSAERRAAKIESDLDELEKRVTHAQKNIAILDERTRGRE